jgi:hypothetical protein
MDQNVALKWGSTDQVSEHANSIEFLMFSDSLALSMKN